MGGVSIKNIKELDHNKNINNTNGVFSILNNLFFYKVLDEDDFEKEISGYKLLKKMYQVSKLVYSCSGTGLIMYEYNDSNKKNEGLLVDYFSKNNDLNNTFYSVLGIYEDAFNKSLKYCKKGNCKTFFENRLDTRLSKNIDVAKRLGLDGLEIKFNNMKIKLSPSNIYDKTIEYFKNLKKEWCIISNCDPNDLNICLDKTLFDYTGGGYVPITAEFAVYVCYNLVQGEYLSLKYNKKSFKDHAYIFKRINECFYHHNDLRHTPRNVRQEAVAYYAKNIFNPIIKKIKYNNWYYDFKHYFIMKLLAVFNFEKMSKKDIILSLSYAQIFFDEDICTVEDLLIFIEKLYK